MGQPKMSEAEELIKKEITLEEIQKLLENKLLEPKYRNKLTSDENVSNLAMMYLIVRNINDRPR